VQCPTQHHRPGYCRGGEEGNGVGGVSADYFIYRLYSSEDQLLYIGITNNPNQRFRHHRSTSSWYTKVARQDVRKINCTKDQIELMERDAINRENPAHNVIHKPRLKDRITKAICFSITEDDFNKLDSICYTRRIKKADFFRSAICSGYESLKKSGEVLQKPNGYKT
jgi:predicted GIY-YIG superfamily endonuclease